MKRKNVQENLYSASQKGDLDKVVKLLRNRFLAKKADVNDIDDKEKTPLHHATINGHKDIVKLLIDSGANVVAKDKWGATPLHEAIKNSQGEHSKYYEIVELLLNNGADIEAENGWDGTPLCLALNEKKINLAKLLIHNGANPNVSDGNYNTPLFIATKAKYNDIIELLKSKGALLGTEEIAKLKEESEYTEKLNCKKCSSVTSDYTCIYCDINICNNCVEIHSDLYGKHYSCYKCGKILHSEYRDND